MLIDVEGELPRGTTAKDLCAPHYRHDWHRQRDWARDRIYRHSASALDMAGRMTPCNLSIEAGARAGMIAPDEKTFAWIESRRFAPQDAHSRRHARSGNCCDPICARATSPGDDPCRRVAPMVTLGTSPESALPVGGSVPDPTLAGDSRKCDQAEAMMRYMGMEPGQELLGTPIDVVFVGSCINGRIEDLRAAARIAIDRRVAPNAWAVVLPGSDAVKAQAEAEGLDCIFLDAGFEWRETGCSMC